MSATRPVVLIFEEFATLSITPATPDLECLITGPAFWIQDFPDDRTNIKLGTSYGIVATSAASGSAVVTTSLSVTDAPNNKVGAILDQSSVKVYAGNALVELAFGTDMTTTTLSPTIGSAGTDFLAAGVLPLDTIVLTDPAGPTTLVRTVITVAQHSLTVNSETPAGFAATAIHFRVERKLPDTKIDSSFVTFGPGANQVTIAALTTMLVSNVAKRIIASDMYIAYRSMRTDLQDVKTLSSTAEIEGQLGRIDARNPLAVGLSVALQNTNTSLQYYGIGTNDLTGYTGMKNNIGSRSDIYAVVPLSQDILVLAMLKAEFEALADPNNALTQGVPQKFRVAIGQSTALPLTKLIVDVNTDGETQVNAADSAPSTHHTLHIPGVNLVTSNVQPGDTFRVLSTASSPAAGANDTATSPRTGDYTVSQVLSATDLELSTEPPGGAESGDATIQILVGTSASIRVAATPITALATLVDSKLFTDLYDPNGTFVDAGVLPTDIIEMPRNPTQSSFTDKDSFVVATVVSNQRVRIVNNGRNTPLVANELPHGASRNSPVTLIPNTQTQTYRVTRTLDKTGQVTTLVSVSQSLASRRVVDVWPDLCDVGGLVDGSLARDPNAPLTLQPAATQPGYYLACTVGGMTAGLPSHQGFTNLGIAGIKKIYNANTYFNDSQLSSISNGGWFVFQQDTPQALPTVVHQLTTDVSALETGEFSMVKNFDFVSLFLAGILDEFIGIWNINVETMGFISAGITGGIDNLKLRRKPRIGAPLIDGKITSLAQSVSSKDRLELYVEANFPAPLNTVALHLVST